MYIHGRRKFTWEPQFLKNMRENLATGGLLGDACCGSREFDTAFRDFVKELYPDKKLERIPLDDELFGEKINGRAITTVRCRTGEARRHCGGGVSGSAAVSGGDQGQQSLGDHLQQIRSGLRLEKHKSLGMQGPRLPKALLRLAWACVLYALKR